MSKRPAKAGVGHRIEIAAPATAVWSVIADLNRWGDWNPLYTQASGAPTVGSTLGMTVALEGMKPQQAIATVVAMEPNRLLEYEIVNMGGLVKAFRYIEIVPLGEDRCAVANYEIMSGAVGNVLALAIGGKVGKGLQAMNEALKAKVEG